MIFLINNRIINENNKIKDSILKKLIDYIKHYHVISENNVKKLKCSSKIIIFKNDIFIISVLKKFITINIYYYYC